MGFTKKRLKQLLLALSSLLLLSYLLFPLWVSPLVRLYLPSEMRLKVLDVDYPSLSQIRLNQMVLEWGDNQLTLDQLQWNFRQGQIKLKQLRLAFTSAQTVGSQSISQTAWNNPMASPVELRPQVLALFMPLAKIYNLSIRQVEIKHLVLQLPREQNVLNRGSSVNSVKTSVPNKALTLNGQRLESLHGQQVLFNIEPDRILLSAELSINQATKQSLKQSPKQVQKASSGKEETPTLHLELSLSQSASDKLQLAMNLQSFSKWQLLVQHQALNLWQPEASMTAVLQLDRPFNEYLNRHFEQAQQLSAAPPKLQLKQWHTRLHFKRLSADMTATTKRPAITLNLSDGIWTNVWQLSASASPLEGRLTASNPVQPTKCY
ncbi:MAG: hypothetical protein Q9M92_05980 [Enterobacterales bacterium]|nr:hypothetical protein [Enterobacterales bacterium]